MTNKKIKKVTKKMSRRSDEEMPDLNSARTTRRTSKAINIKSDYQDILRDLAASPTVRYVAGGLATALLTRLANNWADKYPEISTFIRDNLDNLETKFGISKEEVADTSRH